MKKSEKIAKLLCGLDTIWLIAVDYDGETTVKGLKGLVDEIKRTANDAMHKRARPKGFKSWKAYAKAKGLHPVRKKL